MPRMTPKTANLAALGLVLIGCLPVAGYLLDARALRGLGAATAAAPFPKVFSAVDGLETIASEFTLHWRDGANGAHALVITPEVYSRLRGAYNRRNVYGAALSYAPRLPAALWQSVFCFGLAPKGPLRREFGLPADAKDFSVEIRTQTRNRTDRWMFQPPCNE